VTILCLRLTFPESAAQWSSVTGALLHGRTARELIDALVQEGASLEEIEREVIDASPMGEDSRAALWLYAWGSIERRSGSLAASA